MVLHFMFDEFLSPHYTFLASTATSCSSQWFTTLYAWYSMLYEFLIVKDPFKYFPHEQSLWHATAHVFVFEFLEKKFIKHQVQYHVRNMKKSDFIKKDIRNMDNMQWKVVYILNLQGIWRWSESGRTSFETPGGSACVES